MQPFLEVVKDNEKLLNNTLDYGQFLWNKAVAESFPNHPKSKKLERVYSQFFDKQKNPELAEIFLTRKRERFAEHSFFIVKHISSSDKENGFSMQVVVESIV